MKSILSYLWQLPQNLLGLLLFAIYRGNKKAYNDVVVMRVLGFGGGISLGKYIMVGQFASKDDVKHEYGHCLQSRKLGWLYLPVVGVFSLLHAGLCRCMRHSYFDVWTEKWANKLVGVQR